MIYSFLIGLCALRDSLTINPVKIQGKICYEDLARLIKPICNYCVVFIVAICCKWIFLYDFCRYQFSTSNPANVRILKKLRHRLLIHMTGDILRLICSFKKRLRAFNTFLQRAGCNLFFSFHSGSKDFSPLPGLCYADELLSHAYPS